MKYILFFTLWLLFHGNNVAKFTIHKKDKIVIIVVDLEASDLSSALKLSPKNITEKQIETYLLEHVNYTVNQKKVPFTVSDVTFSLDHFTIQTILSKQIDTITSLKIKNTTLFEVNSKQSNIIELRFNNMYRDFLIDKHQPTLNINL